MSPSRCCRRQRRPRVIRKGIWLRGRRNTQADLSLDTLFRPGSISKLFTWTSVMQLVEQGKLDLDRDVNDYLDFKIPVAFENPSPCATS